jgi:PmbA protein
VYVTNDWYLRYQNYATGDFSVIPRDAMFLIKNGQIEKSIRELRISDNMLRILSNVSSLTRERKWVKWWEVEVPTLSPSVLIDNINFTKSSM